MCDFVEDERDASAGQLLALCDDPVAVREEHVLSSVFEIEPEDDTVSADVGRSLVSAFVSTAKSVVVENSYFDMDYRSELVRLQEVSFQPMDADVSRVHFFSDVATGTDVRLRDFVAEAEGYLGYTIVRPQIAGRFGRSIVTAKASIDEGRVPPDVAERRIRTAVLEPVQLFGVDLEATGVPFMEQDGRLLRCAHVSAWMCHFAAVLRGDVTRRLSGHFHSSEVSVESVGRPFPSQGLTIPMLSGLLRSVDLPPEVIDEEDILRGRRRSDRWLWSDSRSLVESCEAAGDTKDAQKHIWARLNLTSTIARYVNSSIPVILARSTREHTQVVVGYIRANDRIAGTPADAEGVANPVVAFIVSDDQEGPYQIVEVDELVTGVLGGKEGIHLVVPLPRSLWMPGSVAEIFGIKWLRSVVDDLKENSDGNTATLAQFATKMEDRGALAVRTHVTTGTDFKRSIAKRLTEPEVVRRMGNVQLPQFVWVVEVFERPIASPTAKASAMIVFDPTGPVSRDEGQPGSELDAEPLIIYLPGFSYVTPPPWYAPEDGPAWIEIPPETFDSGRSGHSTPHGRRRGGKNAVAGIGAIR